MDFYRYFYGLHQRQALQNVMGKMNQIALKPQDVIIHLVAVLNVNKITTVWQNQQHYNHVSPLIQTLTQGQIPKPTVIKTVIISQLIMAHYRTKISRHTIRTPVRIKFKILTARLALQKIQQWKTQTRSQMITKTTSVYRKSNAINYMVIAKTEKFGAGQNSPKMPGVILIADAAWKTKRLAMAREYVDTTTSLGQATKQNGKPSAHQRRLPHAMPGIVKPMRITKHAPRHPKDIIPQPKARHAKNAP